MKYLFLILLTTLSMACARPDYVTPEELNPTSQSGPCPLYFSHNHLCFEITWKNGPVVGPSSDFTVRFWNKNTGSRWGPFVNPPGQLGILLWMPSMSHGSAPVTITPIADGEFSVSKVYFIMPKDWEVRFSLEQNNQVIDEAKVGLYL